MTHETNRIYKTSQKAREDALARYAAARGSEYRSHAQRRHERSLSHIRKASDALSTALTAELELINHERSCSSCGEVLPLDKHHFVPCKASRHGLRRQCRACFAGYPSWSAREAAQVERQETKRRSEIAKAQARAKREAIAAVKRSDAYKDAQRTIHTARAMVTLYDELSAIAGDLTLTTTEMSEALLGTGRVHHCHDFLEMNSPAFALCVAGKEHEVDRHAAARTWAVFRDRWLEKLADAERRSLEMLRGIP